MLVRETLAAEVITADAPGDSDLGKLFERSDGLCTERRDDGHDPFKGGDFS